MRISKLLPLIPALLLCAVPTLAAAAVAIGISVNVAPPELPVYEQPPLPAPGYLWSPGYWAWDGTDYYWVPGTWVLPPDPDLLWTPGYWGWNNGLYVWNDGYWGPEVGFYGGVNYGYGYTGVGFQGGYWHGGAFFYNREVANFGRVNIVNVYSTPVTVRETTRISFNGGQGGVRAQPTPAERAFMTQHHAGPTSLQRQHEMTARAMPALHSTQNGGRPQILTTSRPGDFAHPGSGVPTHQRTVPEQHGAGPQLQDHERAAPEARGAGPQLQDHQQVAPEARGAAPQVHDHHQRAAPEPRGAGPQLQEGGAGHGVPQDNGAPHGQPGEGPRPQGQPHEQKPRPPAPHPEQKREPERHDQ